MNKFIYIFQISILYFFSFSITACSLLPCVIPSGEDSNLTKGVILPLRSEPIIFSPTYRLEQTLLFCEETPDCHDPKLILLNNENDDAKFNIGTSYAVSLRGVNQYICAPGALDVHQGHVGFKIESINQSLQLKNNECLNYNIPKSSRILNYIKHSPNVKITNEIMSNLDSIENYSFIKFQLCWNNSSFQIKNLQLIK